MNAGEWYAKGDRRNKQSTKIANFNARLAWLDRSLQKNWWQVEANSSWKLEMKWIIMHYLCGPSVGSDTDLETWLSASAVCWLSGTCILYTGLILVLKDNEKKRVNHYCPSGLQTFNFLYLHLFAIISRHQSINQSAWTCYGAPHPKLWGARNTVKIQQHNSVTIMIQRRGESLV